jgi:hypothetical protein
MSNLSEVEGTADGGEDPLGDRVITLEASQRSLASELTTEVVQRLVVLNKHFLQLSTALPDDETPQFYEKARAKLEEIVEDCSLMETIIETFEQRLAAFVDDGFLGTSGSSEPQLAIDDTKRALSDIKSLIPKRVEELTRLVRT